MRHKTIILKKVGTYKAKKCQVKKGELNLPKGIQEENPSVSPECVFEEEKPFWKFWRNPHRLIIHVEGDMKPISIIRDGDKAGELDMGFLNLDDIINAVKRTMVRYISKIKPLRMDMFMVLLAVGVVNIVISGYLLMKLLAVMG